MADQEFEQLLATIEKINTQLSSLAGKIDATKKEMTSGHWGTQQIKEFRDELNKLTQQFAGKQLKLQGLVNERDIIQSTRALQEASRGFDSLAKSISSTERRIAELKEKRGGIVEGAFGSRSDIAYYTREIEKLERALASFQSRMRTQYNPQGLRVQPGTGNQPFDPIDDLNQRLANGYGASVSESVYGKNVKSINALGRNAAEKILNQLQNELLQGAIDARIGAFQETSFARNLAATRPVSPGLQAAVNRANAPAPTSAEVLEMKRRLDAMLYGGQNPLITTIDKPPKSPETLFNEQLRRNIEYETKAKPFIEDIRARQNFEDLVPERAFRPSFDDLKNEKVTDEFGRTLSQREIIERQATEEAKRLISAEKKYTHALEVAAQQGFSPENLKRLRTRGTGGIEQLQFQRTDEYGRQRNLDLFVNQQGRATAGISNQFRTFGQGVVRDIGELTKWSIALAAVYGPLKKLQELTQIMIENQARLAEAVTSVSSAFVDQEDIFNTAADAANRAGESVSGVIDAFTQAYRATGGGSDQVERYSTATTLLNDALLLSKLSTLDQAGAIDTLSAALRQSGDDLEGNNNILERGSSILDKWVRVTKVANVDLASLATGFAVLGDASDAAQISVDELNGLLGAIAETGVASGRELANTARAIVAGVQSDQAREALENIGVAFEDSTGKARPFLELMTELSNLRKTGALDDTAFSRLTLALGGGTRRQAAYATFIENIGRVNEIAAESAQANGDAQAALARQLETVQTSLTRLGNSFQALAQSMGTEGGFLGIITSMVDGTTTLVNVFDKLTSILGKATPALIAFIAASALASSKGYAGLGGAVQTFGQSFLQTPQQREEQALLARLGAPVPFRQRAGNFIGQNIFGTNAVSGGVQGLLAAALPAILNATNKEDRFGGTKAVANIVGGVGGGIVGALVAGSPVIGAAVGVAISEAFVNSTIARKTDLFGYATGPTLGEQGAGKTTNGDLDEALRQAEIKLYESIGLGNESLGRFISAPSRANEVMVDRLNEAIREGNRELFEKRLGATQNDLAQLGITPELARQAFEGRQEIQVTPENRAYRLASEEARRAYDEVLAQRVAQGGTPLDQTTAFSRLVESNQANFKQLLDRLKESSRENLRRDRISGDIRGAEFGRRTTAIQGFDTRALQYYTALGDQVGLITGGADDAASAFNVLNNVIVSGSEDALPQLTSISGEIQNIINLLATAEGKQTLTDQFGSLGEAEAQLKTLQETLAAIITDINQQVLVGQLKIPDVQGDVNKPLTTPDFNLVQQRAKDLQDDFYQGFLQIPDDMYDALKDSWDEWAQIIKDSGDVFFRTVSEIDPQFFQQAMQQLLEENKLKSQETNPFGIQQLDITSGEGAGLQASIDYFSAFLAQNFPQYQQNPEDIGVIFSDYVTDILHGDNLAIKLALDALNDKAQKQLDGQYNIPEGATFWVPLTAAYYRPQNQGGAGGMPAVDAAAVDGNTSATDRNTQALDTLGSRFTYWGDKFTEEQIRPKLTEGSTQGREKIPQETIRRSDDYAVRHPADVEELRGYGRSRGLNRAEDTPVQAETFLQTLQNWFRDLFSQIPFGPGGTPSPYQPRQGGTDQTYKGIGSQLSPTQVNPQVNARLEIKMDNTTQLVVDGRVLASVLSPYLAQEMIRLDSSSGTVTRRFVI